MKHPFIQELCVSWFDGELSWEEVGDGFTRIGKTGQVSVVVSDRHVGDIKRFIRRNMDMLVIVLHGDCVDLYMRSLLDERPVVVHDFDWRKNREFLEMGKLGTALEFAFELDRRYGHCRMEKQFVRDFRVQCRKLASSWTGLADDSEEIRHRLSLHTLLRIVFVAFLEVRGALDGRRHFVMEEALDCVQEGKSIYHDFLRPFFFNTLNKPVHRRSKRALEFGEVPFLNGGLFTPSELEQSNPMLDAPNQIWLSIFETLVGKYSYEEAVGDDSQTESLDPFMLGRVFESLMSSGRRAMTGSFYTPVYFARRMVIRTLAHWMTVEFGLSMKHALDICEKDDFSFLSNEQAQNMVKRLDRLTILDPSVGSGAFLQSALIVLHRIYTGIMRVIGIPVHPGMLARQILVRNLYGVDILQDATELCTLRLWLEIVRYYPIGEILPSLPNIDMNICCGDSLIDMSQYRRRLGLPCQVSDDINTCEKLKRRYRMATGDTKKKLASAIHQYHHDISESLYSKLMNIYENDTAGIIQRSKSLFGGEVNCTFSELKELRLIEQHKERLRKYREGGDLLHGFDYDVHFGKIQAEGGFDIVIGNPPWFLLHTMPVEIQKIMRSLYETANGTPGKHAQSSEVGGIFVEKAVQCVRKGGIVCMLLPNKLFHAPSYHSFREYIDTHSDVLEIQDYSESGDRIFGAATYPCSMIIKKSDMIRHPMSCGEGMSARRVIDPSVGVKNSIYPKMKAFWTVKRGICTGANDIFIGKNKGRISDTLSMVSFKKNTLMVPIESDFVRPGLRGAHISPFHYEIHDSIIFTHDLNRPEMPLEHLPRHISDWMGKNITTLENRKPSRKPYYTLSGCSRELTCMKVVWRDISQNIEACFIDDPKVLPMNTVYYIPVCNEYDGYLLAAFLNSSMARVDCRNRAEHAQNGYRRYFAWVIEELPWFLGGRKLSREITDEIVSLSRICHQKKGFSVDDEMVQINRLISQARQICESDGYRGNGMLFSA